MVSLARLAPPEVGGGRPLVLYAPAELSAPVCVAASSTRNSIEAPRGGPPPPTLFCPAHGGRIGLRGRTLGCTLKKVGILSLFSLFGIFGSFCIFGIVDFRRHVLEDLLGRNLPKIFKK